MAAEGSSSTAGEPQDVLGQYELWKKNVPFIYDVCIAHALEWPSLTVQLMPHVTTHRDRGCEVHRAILGTHTNEQENYLLIAEITVPKEFDTPPTSAEPAEVGFSLTANKIEIKKRIYHEGEVNRARYMPQKPSTVATKTPGADVLIFDTDKFLDPVPEEKVVKPTLRLKGHTKEGYGLAWNPQKTGHLLSASDDCTICLWDINERTQANGKLQAMTIFRFHTDVVEDVTWHTMHDTLFASVSDDRMLCLWDTRSKEAKPSQSVAASDKEVNCVQYSPFSEFILATGGADRAVKLWDTRNLKSELHSFCNHRDEVFNINWSPHEETVLASSGADFRLCLWDLNRIGDEQTEEDAQDGPPELLFQHAGHTAKISDFTWSPQEPWMLASVSEDNVIQIWKPAEDFCESENQAPK